MPMIFKAIRQNIAKSFVSIQPPSLPPVLSCFVTVKQIQVIRPASRLTDVLHKIQMK